MLDPTSKELVVALGKVSNWASNAERDWLLKEVQKEASRNGGSMDELFKACVDDIAKTNQRRRAASKQNPNPKIEQDLGRKDKAKMQGSKANKTTRGEPTSTHKEGSWGRRVEGFFKLISLIKRGTSKYIRVFKKSTILGRGP